MSGDPKATQTAASTPGQPGTATSGARPGPQTPSNPQSQTLSPDAAAAAARRQERERAEKLERQLAEEREARERLQRELEAIKTKKPSDPEPEPLSDFDFDLEDPQARKRQMQQLVEQAKRTAAEEARRLVADELARRDEQAKQAEAAERLQQAAAAIRAKFAIFGDPVIGHDANSVLDGRVWQYEQQNGEGKMTLAEYEKLVTRTAREMSKFRVEADRPPVDPDKDQAPPPPASAGTGSDALSDPRRAADPDTLRREAQRAVQELRLQQS